ncbi:AAA family ATPase [Flavobacterium sp. K77]|uniref:UvrD-helicase domain-containing protein n=1 Tax=Flavobacterium sp. K77 TaxID=2910676 RepID=UPI001F45AD6A|nr:UvrD-helicase domain-containing protein [Flavobacterium sp. K77]MCF6142346.1 AAA family ATPase [Flavobacterium sp. K77]
MSNAIEQIKTIIESNQLKDETFKNFVLQGGAGSGKTESLKELISFISDKYPDAKIACITHTNVAVDEIKKRVGDKYDISTIHSFLNSLIKNYKRNIKQILNHIFCLSEEEITNHDDYKKRYEKYSKKTFLINNKISAKVIGKRDYDKGPEIFNFDLLSKIKSLNEQIVQIISEKDQNTIGYNETKFDSFEDLTFSHDSLLTIAYKLCEKYDLLSKIISDKYDFIFIDEYQDTNPLIINLFLGLLPKSKKTTIGLFGDSMQGIYDDGIGDVNQLIESRALHKVDKDDNYRCSVGVISFINQLRNDSIEQKLALKIGENETNRNGKTKLFYKIIGKKPNAFSSQEDKQLYVDQLNSFIIEIKNELKFSASKLLMLTNKSISSELGFSNLYNTFNDRFTDVKDEIEKELAKIQILEIVELTNYYNSKNYNPLLVALKKNGFVIKTIEDKEKVTNCFGELTKGTKSLSETLQYCYENKLIRKSERAANYEKNKNKFLAEFNGNQNFLDLETLYCEGINTVSRLQKDKDIEISQEKFDDFIYNFRKKKFFEELFSEKIKLKDVFNYINYLNEESDYITMHKTKGSGIENVIVVLDEYFWNKYNFKSIYDDSAAQERRLMNQKIFYVACSRAIKDLVIIRLVEDESEENMLLEYFKNCEIKKK